MGTRACSIAIREIADSLRARNINFFCGAGAKVEGVNFFRRGTLGWTLAYAGKTAQLKHRKGLGYIATLLREPQRKVHVCDLACTSAAHSPDPSRPSPPVDPDVEKARKAVRNAIRNAVTCIEDVHPELGRHLHNCIITGCFCYYRPERTIVWEIEG